MTLIADHFDEAFDIFEHLATCRDRDCHWCADRPSDEQVRQERISALFNGLGEPAS